jgi:autophagy-related protein 2
VRAFSVLVDYKPRRVDVAALREGSLAELVNLVPWGGVDLGLKGLRLAGLSGWDGVGAACAQEWLHHIASTQVGAGR